MTMITVSAQDSAQAMDEIVAKLGTDAMIIETVKRNGRIEMVATDDPNDQPKAKRPAKREDDAMIAAFAKAREQAHANGHGAPLGVIDGDANSTLQMLADRPVPNDDDIASFTNIFDQQMLATPIAQPAPQEEATSRPRSDHSGAKLEREILTLKSEIASIKSMLTGMLITQPDGVNSELGRTPSLKLIQAGFSQDVVQTLRPQFAHLPDEAAIGAFCDAFADSVIEPKIEQLLSSRVIFVVGASGSGKTVLTSKIAAHCRGNGTGTGADTSNNNRIVIGSVRDSGNDIGDHINDYARLMNMKSVCFTPEELPTRVRETSCRLILDVTVDSDVAVNMIDAAIRALGTDKVSVIQAIPGGTSATMLSYQCGLYHSLQPAIALTKLDECESMPEELSVLATKSAGIGLLTGTKSIVDGIAIATSPIMTQYLRENSCLQDE
jgi:flagellar biosynthesis GTPase FlhF